ncbi:hypothetical protein I6A60_01745 [Frankia sp. AgB1.9]|uniref:hypothetical protein n=1 Tax=unclassified Frankia TaxID=2632575 RepID=UPI001934946B|nr:MULTISPECIES: hypothetical protein [unclassified Frankia]MBL7491330.1 hypothetical protein [Frankia sp. AgW1.1]MBL7546608.1 hypothetical protein [Frankia sp. AgB1.9]MBL7622406.1 hypothetical protein [Frankia sp. AgB1.8]
MATLPISAEARRSALLLLASRCAGHGSLSAIRRDADSYLPDLADLTNTEERAAAWSELLDLVDRPIPSTQLELVGWTSMIRRQLLILVPPTALNYPVQPAAEATQEVSA